MSQLLDRLYDDLGDQLDRIKRLFKNAPRVTLVVRSPELPDGDVVIGDDDLDAAVAAIQRLKDRAPTHSARLAPDGTANQGKVQG